MEEFCPNRKSNGKSLVFLEALHPQFPCGAVFGFFLPFLFLFFTFSFFNLFLFFVSDEPVRRKKGRWWDSPVSNPSTMYPVEFITFRIKLNLIFWWLTTSINYYSTWKLKTTCISVCRFHGTFARIIMKPYEMPTGNGQSPVVPPLAPSGFLDAVSREEWMTGVSPEWKIHTMYSTYNSSRGKTK